VPAEPSPRNTQDRTALAIAAVATLTGLVWIAQGLGVPIGGSFMIGDLRWTAIGLGVVAVAAVFAWRRLRRCR
jgi:hypothetical protein